MRFSRESIGSEVGRGYTESKLLRPYPVSRSGPGPLFFRPKPGMQDLKENIQQQLVELDPELGLVAVERPGNDALRIFIEHPGGVDLALCERVTRHLGGLTADYSLEVSSPGPKYRRANHVPETKEQLQ
jgi:hypothetical protein